MAQEAINTAFQLGVTIVIAFLVWLAARFIGRVRQPFFKFIGLSPPPAKAMLWALIGAIVLGGATLALFKVTLLSELATADNTVTARVRAAGVNAETLGLVVLIAFVKTSLSEEIFFRGLLAKRLIGWLGFHFGNAIHAAAFGAVHLLIFVVPGGPEWNAIAAASFFAVSGGAGWIMAWLNERVGEGSIAPSWLMHGLSNAISYPVLAFL
jgi:uncharacterized protein